MGYGTIFVEKVIPGSKPWTNEYSFNNDVPGPLTDDDLSAIGAGVDFTDANTNVAGEGWDPTTTTLMQAVLAFERAMHFSLVQFTRIYVSDGKKNSAPTDIGPFASHFYTQGLEFQAIRAVAGGDGNRIAPGTIVAYVRRDPSGFSQRSGHISYRLCLLDEEVNALNPDLVGWTGGANRLAFQAMMEGFLQSSGLNKFFNNGYRGSLYTGIGRHIPEGAVLTPGQDVGDLFAVAKIQGMTVDRPRSRQKSKGRKKNAS